MKKFISIFLVSLIVLTFTSFKSDNNSTSKSGNLKISLTNIRNSSGYIYIFIYQYKNQYPYEPYKHYKVSKSKILNGNLIAKIDNLSFNNYAISLIDDENNNKDLDRWLGIPSEGYGFSNNAKPLLSLPKYNELVFTFNAPKKISIKLQYLL